MKSEGGTLSREARRAELGLGCGLALLCLCGLKAQTQTPGQSQSQAQAQSQTQSRTSSTQATAANDAAAKTAERKRKFDEQRKMLESGYSPSKEESRGRGDLDLMLSPMDMNLLVHDRVQFYVYDKGKEVGGGSWSAMPGRVLSSWFEKGGIFTIEAKSPGTARVGVMVGSRATNVIVTVYPGDKMPKGVERTAEAIKPAGSQ